MILRSMCGGYYSLYIDGKEVFRGTEKECKEARYNPQSFKNYPKKPTLVDIKFFDPLSDRAQEQKRLARAERYNH